MVGKNSSYFILFLLYSFCVGCNSYKKEIPNALKYSSKTFLLNLYPKATNDNNKARYLYAWNSFSYKDTVYLSFINHKALTLNLINYSYPEKDVKVIRLPKEINPDVYGFISSTFLDLENNKLAFFQSERIGLLNLTTDSIEFLINTQGTDENPIFYLDNHFPIFYSNKEDRVYSRMVHFYETEKRKFPFEHEFQADIHILTDEVNFCPIKYPESFDKGQFGLSGFVSYAVVDSCFLYNFSTENYLLKYNFYSQNVDTIRAESDYFSPILKLATDSIWDNDKNIQNRKLSFKYTTILYDKWNKRYYRTYQLNQPLRDSDGFYNTSQTKKSGAIIFDNEFKKLGELTFSDNGADWFGVSKNGIFYSTTDTNKSKVRYVEVQPIIN